MPPPAVYQEVRMLDQLLSGNLILLVIVAAMLFLMFSSAVRIVQEYERGVVFRLGRLAGARGPGLILLIPAIERMRIVDLRVVTLDVPPQEAITRDNVTVKVSAVAYFRVLHPARAVVEVRDYLQATSLIAQTTLRSVLGQSALDTHLAEGDQINNRLKKITGEQ